MERTFWTIRSPSGLQALCSVTRLEGSSYLLTVIWNDRPLVQESYATLDDASKRADDVKSCLMERDWSEDALE